MMRSRRSLDQFGGVLRETYQRTAHTKEAYVPATTGDGSLDSACFIASFPQELIEHAPVLCPRVR